MTIHRCVQPKYRHEVWTLFIFLLFYVFLFFIIFSFLFFFFFFLFFFFSFFFSFFFFFFLFFLWAPGLFYFFSYPSIAPSYFAASSLGHCWKTFQSALPPPLCPRFRPLSVVLRCFGGGLLSFSGWRFGRPGLGDPLRLAHEARHAPVICFAVLQPPLRVEVLQRGGGRAIHCWLGRCSQELQVLLHHRTNLSLHCPSQPPAFSLGQMSRS